MARLGALNSNTTTGFNIAKGSATLSGGTAVVSNSAITSTSIVLLMPSGTTNAGLLDVTLSAGVGFTINSLNILDGRTIQYLVVYS